MPKQPNPDDIEVTVPLDQLDAIRTSLLELYQVSADALNHDATRHLRTGDSLAAVHGRRAELAVLDGMLEQVGWPGDPAIEDGIRLSASPPRLREAIWVALSRAAGDLDDACGGYWHGGSDLDELRRRLETVRGLLTMLAEAEGAG
jgi:hypothetical protein